MSARRNLKREVRNGKAVYVPQPAPVVVRPSRHRRRWFGIGLAQLIILLSWAVLVGLLWLSLQYLTNPDVAFWLDAGLGRVRAAPHTAALRPQTLRQIETDLTKEGLTAGQPIVLKQDFAFHRGVETAADIAIPTFIKDTAADCTDPCKQIRQLRIYRTLQLPFLIRFFQRDPYFRLTDTLAIRGPSAADLLNTEQNPLISAGSDQPLPLTQAEVYDVAPQPGLWLKLIGLRTQGSGVSAYGQIFYFNPFRERLDLMNTWVSPPGEVPQWQQVTGDGQPELVVNQMVGAEPQYSVYQLFLADGTPQQLRPILLSDPAFANPDYANALILARSGLWAPAQTLLTTVKRDNPKRWSAAAQAQLDLIQLHANVTQAQANQPSASTVQRILGYLINGSWRPALEVLQSDRASRAEVKEMLLSDTGRLGSRIETALTIFPTDPSLVAWGAMLRRVRNSETQAIAWAQRQSKGNAATMAQVNSLLKLLNQPLPDADAVEPQTSPSAAQTLPSKDTLPRAAQSPSATTTGSPEPQPSAPAVATPTVTPSGQPSTEAPESNMPL